MANWQGLQNALSTGFTKGLAMGGRNRGLALGMKQVADDLRTQRENQKKLGQYILGQILGIKIKQALKPPTQPIVSRTGEVLGTRPTGSVFAPKEKAASDIFEENIKNKIAQGQPLTTEEMDYYNKFLVSGVLREPFRISEPTVKKKPKVSFFKNLFKKKKPVQERFNELIQSMSEDEAYQQLIQEGY